MKFLTSTLILMAILTGCSSFKKNNTTKRSQIKKDKSPLLTRPTVKKKWVKDKIEGNRYIEGHWEYVIEKNSKWTK